MTIEKIFSFLEHMGKITNSGTVALTVSIELCISLLIMFFLRTLLIFKSAKIKFFKEEKFIKQRGIILNHIGLEIIISFIVSYIFLLMINTTSGNIILNMLFVPLLGQIIAICIDDWILIPKETDAIFNKVNLSESHTVNTIQDIAEIKGAINHDIVNSNDFRPIIVNTINDIKKVQEEHESKINVITDKCNETVDLLAKLQESEKNDKKISLKKTLYNCLNNGFVTPEEREKIEIDYYSYINLLGGNSDVQELYEKHYKKLDVHEDRRKENKTVAYDKRQDTYIKYGQYDSENKDD